MADEDSVNKLIRTLIRTTLGMSADSVRPANQQAPTGILSQQFATVLILSVDPVTNSAMGAVSSMEDEALPSTNVEESIELQYIVRTSIQFFKGNALAQARRLSVLFASSAALEAMQKIGLGLLSVSAIRDLTGLVDTQWEERGQLDVSFTLLAREILSVATYNRFRFEISSDKTSTTISEVITP